MTSMLLLVLAAAPDSLSGDSLTRYQDAVKKVQTGAYGDATVQLNALSSEHPRVPEIFATRCSAQLGLNHVAAAEADCNYALQLKPGLSNARYGLAVAEDRGGKSPQAVEHYRQYAQAPDASPQLKSQALARADQLAAPQPLEVPPPPPPSAVAAAPMPAPQQASATVYVYRNHMINVPGGQVTLFIDDKEVGDIGHDQYVELTVGPGEHIVEACLGGARYRRGGLEISTTNGDLHIGQGAAERYRGLTVPVTVRAGGRSYVNLDTVSGVLMLVNQPQEKGAEEMRSDCTRAFSRNMQ
ncbi:MAG: hypothetical protein QM723_32540 [Myxococcaceae bacterium]